MLLLLLPTQAMPPPLTAMHGAAAGAGATTSAGPTHASPPPAPRRGLPWHGVDLTGGGGVASEGPLPASLQPPPLPDDPGLDGFAAGLVGEAEDASPACSLNLDLDLEAAPTNPFADPTPAPPHASVLIRAAVAAWGAVDGNPAENLAVRAGYARWLGGRLGLRPVDGPSALGAALGANARLARDLGAAAAAVRSGQALPGVYGPADWADDDAGRAARAAWAGAEAGRLTAAAAAAAAAPPFAGALRLTLLSYRPSARLASPFSAGEEAGSERAGSSRRGGGGGGGGARRWWACCAVPAALEDGEEEDGDDGGPARPSRWAAAHAHVPRRRPAAYAQVWLHEPPPPVADGGGGNDNRAAPVPPLERSRSGGRRAPPPPPPPRLLPSFRTPAARRGAGAAWGVSSPSLAVPRPGCGLEVRVCDEVRPPPPDAASAPSADPVIGTAFLALADVVRALGCGGGGGTVWALPLYARPAHASSSLVLPATHTLGTPLVGGTPLLPAPGSADDELPPPGAAAARGDLVGVVRVVVDFVCDDRTTTPGGGGGDDASSPSTIPATSDPHAVFDELTTALWRDWRAARGELQALLEEEEEKEKEEEAGPGPLEAGLAAAASPHHHHGPSRRPASAHPEPPPGALPPPPLPLPPPPDGGEDAASGELPGVPGLAAVAALRSRAAAAGATALPADAWLQAARGAAALLRVRPAGQRVALLRCALGEWAAAVAAAAAGRPTPAAAAAGELAADLWAPLAAAARAGSLTLREAADLQAAGTAGVAAALAVVEAYPRLWGGPEDNGQQPPTSSSSSPGVRIAAAALRLLALAVRWDDSDIAGLADPLASHIRRAARAQMVAAAAAATPLVAASPGPDGLVAAAGAAVETASAGLDADLALRPAFAPALDVAAVAGRVRYAAVTRLAAAALVAGGGGGGAARQPPRRRRRPTAPPSSAWRMTCAP